MSVFGWCRAPYGARPHHEKCIVTFTRNSDTVVCECECHQEKPASKKRKKK